MTQLDHMGIEPPTWAAAALLVSVWLGGVFWGAWLF